MKNFLFSFDNHIKSKFTYLPLQIENMSVNKFDGVVYIDSGLASNMFNIMYCTEDADISSVRKAIEYYRSKKLPYAVWIGFESEPLWLEIELQTLGLTSDETEWAMSCDLNKVEMIDSNFNIKQVSESCDDIISVMNGIMPESEHEAIKSFFKQFEAILLSAHSQLTFFVGYENTQPISLSSCFCDKEIASIFDVIVLPANRGKGLGKAMTLKAMHHAKNKGIINCLLTATNDAKHLYKQLGFQDLKTMKVYQEH